MYQKLSSCNKKASPLSEVHLPSIPKAEGNEVSYKLLIRVKVWKDCKGDSKEDVLYVAKTLSKYSRCQVDVYAFTKDNAYIISSFLCGHINTKGAAA